MLLVEIWLSAEIILCENNYEFTSWRVVLNCYVLQKNSNEIIVFYIEVNISILMINV